jgi:arginyl-tRNA synthetase
MTEHASSDERAAAESPLEEPVTSLEGLRGAVLSAAAELSGGALGATAAHARRPLDAAAITLERPPQARLGDYSTNAALLLAPALGSPPREVAERLGDGLRKRLGTGLQRLEVAGPGFVNLFVSDGWLAGALAQMLVADVGWVAVAEPLRERILIEFVSANPTGPMHVGHARNAAYGDSLARLLSAQGHEVRREFYVNDAGTQVRKLGESIQALARGEEVPRDGYKGDYVAALLAGLPDAATMGLDELGRAAVAIMVARLSDSLAAFGVRFDDWTYESSLHAGDPSPVARALAVLDAKGCTYEGDGALWLRTSDFGDDKDRVLVRSSGEHTYFASDIAYHQDKRERGFQRQVDVWGADHHGYVARIKAAYQALGGDPDQLELLIMQLVHLLARGERAQMSKRSGEFVTLDDLVQEIGVDAARWFLLSRSHDTTIELDLDLAREQSNENPVYYVQYAHARIASMLARAGEAGVREALLAASAGGPPSLHVAERALVSHLLEAPAQVRLAADRRAPHRITGYVLELAQAFSAFYRDCRVLGAEPRELESLRVALCVATQRTIVRCLDLLGVSAPLQM